ARSFLERGEVARCAVAMLRAPRMRPCLALLLAACSSPMMMVTDSGYDAGYDAGVDSGVFSACGHLGDRGNDAGVGQYCRTINDCPGSAPICTAFQNSLQPPERQSYYCTTTCDDC